MNEPRGLRLTVEIALAALTCAAVVGMSRLFADGGWLGPLIVNAVAAHAVAALARRRGLGLPSTGLLMIAGAILVTTWTSYGDSTAYGIPTSDTFSLMRDDLSRAWGLYQDVVAPAPVETGFVVASCIALWCIAYLADWAAFRVWVPFEATLPAGTLFLFTALLGEDRGRGWTVGLFAAAVLTFLLLHRTSSQDGRSHWVGDHAAAGHRSLLTAGTMLGALAVLAGTSLGPLLPGATAPGVLDPRALRDGGSSRVTISPLVDIRSRLVNQSNVEVFTVRSPEPAYWRLTALDRFNGTIWTSSGSYADATGALPTSLPADLPAETFDQRFTISTLAAIWLPSAYEPRAIDADGVGVLYEQGSATLIVDREADTSDGLSYRVTSASPRLTAADLNGAIGDVPQAIRDRFLALPEDLSPRVRALAKRLTADSATPYAAALALQNHLRTFTYDLNVSGGHSDDVLEQFLFDTQRGYCEQFAGAFAAMARSIGIPSRVAVGFTQGEADPDDPTLFRVRGEHAHAWPEVYLRGAGWVSFEPTPGRGQPFAEAYTGVPVAQATTSDPSTATTSPPTTTGSTSPPIPSEANRPQGRDAELDTGSGTGGGASSRGRALVSRFLVQPIRATAPVIAVAAATYVVVVPLALLLRRRSRRRRATSPASRIDVQWAEVVEEAALVGYRERRSDTLAERSRELAGALGDDAATMHLRRLSRLAELASYAAEEPDELDAELAQESGAALRETIRAQARRRTRLGRWLDPRPWLRLRRETGATHRRITTTVRGDLEAERELAGSGDRR
ncbi:MAG: transglutaminase family protein [Microthrixaceae bacterium]